MSVHEINPRRPARLSALDIVALTDVEVRAVIIHLAGHQDPAIAAEVAAEVRAILEHTRPGVDPDDLFGNHHVKLDRPRP
jgi:hypothetical protein